jgi:hypothetical protein
MKLRKKLLGYLAVIGLWFAAFAPSTMVGNTAYAQTDKNTTTTSTEDVLTIEQALNELWSLIDLWLKLMYIIIWPMLFLAGIALDNSMVYGSFFHMDAPLWAFWNMTKNFANFALGFIVLFAILKWIFSSFGDKGKDARSPIEIIKKTLIAGVLIQASWFILAAVVDVSTIATYAIGGMPMTLLNDKTIKWSDKQILQTESHLELNNVTRLQEEDFRVWYKTEAENSNWETIWIDISPCLTRKLGTDTYIVGRKFGDAKFKYETISQSLPEDLQISNNNFPLRSMCIFWNEVYFFNEFPNNRNSTTNSEYQGILNHNLNILWEWTETLENCRFIVKLWNEDRWGVNNPTNCSLEEIINLTKNNEKTEEEIKNNDYLAWLKDGSDESLMADWYIQEITANEFYENYWSTKWKSRIGKTLAPTVSQIIDKSQWFVGPFVTIYASIMDFANLSDGNNHNSSIGKNVWSMLIRAGVAIGLVFPLIALAIVLFIRIWFLRAVIAASPILILANVFKDTLKIDLGKHFTIENILQAIFAPVITVFALSISMIFMTTLDNSLSANKVNTMQQLWWTIVDKGEDTSLTIAGFTIIYPKIVDTYAGATGDWFSWMLLSFCGIGIMRFILFAAIKASGTIWAVGEKIKDFGENVFKSAPIIPIGGGMSINWLKYATTIPEQLTQKWEAQQTKDAGEFFESKYGGTLKDLEDGDTDKELNKYEADNIIKTLSSWWNPVDYMKQQKLVNGNATGEEVKEILNTTFAGQIDSYLSNQVKNGKMEEGEAESIKKGIEKNEKFWIDFTEINNKKADNEMIEATLKWIEEDDTFKNEKDNTKKTELIKEKFNDKSLKSKGPIEKTIDGTTYNITKSDKNEISVEIKPESKKK